MRETGECLVKHRVVEHQRHKCRDGGSHVMAESTGEAVPKPVTPRLGTRSAPGRQNDLPCVYDSLRMLNRKPSAMISYTRDSTNAMAPLNLTRQLTTAPN